jgi:hypothetical protein
MQFHIAFGSRDLNGPLASGQVGIALEILSPGPGSYQFIRQEQRILFRMAFEIDAEHLPDLSFIPVGIPVETGE